MRNPAHHENDVQIARADCLIGDVDIAVLDVMRFGFENRQRKIRRGRRRNVSRRMKVKIFRVRKIVRVNFFFDGVARVRAFNRDRFIRRRFHDFDRRDEAITAFGNGSLTLDYLTGANTSYTYDITRYVQDAITRGAQYNATNGLILTPPGQSFNTNFDRLVFGNAYNVRKSDQISLKIYYASFY